MKDRTIKCPRCKTDVDIDISRAIDMDGEIFRCDNCGFPFMYTEE